MVLTKWAYPSAIPRITSASPRLGSALKPANYVGGPSLRVYVHALEFHDGFDRIGVSVGHTANDVGEPSLRVYFQAVYVHAREFHSGFDQIGFSVGHTANEVGEPSLRIHVPARELCRRAPA